MTLEIGDYLQNDNKLTESFECEISSLRRILLDSNNEFYEFEKNI